MANGSAVMNLVSWVLKGDVKRITELYLGDPSVPITQVGYSQIYVTGGGGGGGVIFAGKP